MEPPPKKRCPHSTTAPELTLGAPRTQAASGRYVTKGGVTVDRLVQPLSDPSDALEGLIDQLDQERGCVFQSSYEVPGRYARWTMGFVNPPLAFEAWGRRFSRRCCSSNCILVRRLSLGVFLFFTLVVLRCRFSSGLQCSCLSLGLVLGMHYRLFLSSLFVLCNHIY